MKRFVLLLLALAGCSAVQLPETGPFVVDIDKYGPQDAARLATVLDGASALVDLPLTEVKSTLDIYSFLLDEMPFTAGVLRARKEAKYEIWREPLPDRADAWERDEHRRTVLFDDRAGVELRARLIAREPGRWIYYTYGSYDLGLFRVWGRSVVIVGCEARDGALWTQARVYVKVEGLILEKGAKFLGLVEGTVKRKGFAFIDVATRVSELAASDPKALADGVEGSPDVDPATLAEFRRRFVH